MSALAYLADRLLDRPLLATPAHVVTVVGVLADRLDVGRIALAGETLDPAAVRAGAQGQARVRRGYAVDDGVAIVPVIGTLINRGSSISPQSGLTSYAGIGEALDAALADAGVRGILLDVDSPGGEVSGCLDLARRIRAAAALKPLWAVVDEEANSGAYAIASGAARILVPRTGQVGSVGVVVLHRDRSAALAKEGVKVTIIKAGARKDDGNPFGPLPADVAERVQAAVDDVRDQFVALVAEHRGLPPEAVYGTEADVLLAPAALELGLADDIMPAREAVAAFREHLALAPATTVTPLAGDVLPAPAPESEDPPMTTAATTTYTRPAVAAPAGSLDAIRREVASRFAAVLASPDAQGPLAPLAQHLLGATEMGADEIAAALAVAKGCKAAAGGGHTDFHLAMERLGNPKVGGDEDAGTDEDELQAVLQRFRQREGRR